MTNTRHEAQTWRCVRFGQVAREVREATRDPVTDGLSRIVGLDHLESNDLRLRRWDDLADMPDGTSFTRTFRAGQVLFGKRRAYQRKVAVPDFEGICSGDILVFERSSDTMLPEFLPYVVQSDGFFAHALGTSAGSLSPRTKWQDLAKYEFMLPPLEEQRSVAEVMTQITRNLEGLEAVSNRARTLAQSVIDEAEVGAREWTTLGEILLEAPRNGLTIRPSSKQTGTWSLTIGSASMTGYSPDGRRQIEPPPDSSHFLVRSGDLFVTRSNTLERVGLPFRVPDGEPTALYYSDLLMRLRVDESAMPAAILEHLLRGRRVRGFMRSIAAGTSASMKKINGQNLRKVPIPRLTSDAIRQLEERLTALDEVRGRVDDSAVATRRLRHQLLEAFLAGPADV